MTMSPLLDGKVAVVAGGGRGMGEAISLRLADEGARVVVVDVAEDRAQEIAEKIGASGGTAIGIGADVRDPDAVQGFIDRSRLEFGAIDVLVNNAGGAYLYAARRKMAEWTEEDWDQIMERNLRYVFLTCRAAIPVMIAGGRGGSIVNMASIDGIVSAPFVAPYGASKAGIINLTKTLALEYGADGIRVNAVAPGYVLTPASSGANTPEHRARIPLGRPGSVEDAANVVLFFASPMAAYVSGQTLLLDGAVSTQYPFEQPGPPTVSR